MGTGHIFEIDGHSITNYKKGDYVFWKGSIIPHGNMSQYRTKD